MDLLVAVRRLLVAHIPLTALLGSSERFTSWVFRWQPYEDVEGTGAAAVVLTTNGGWAGANNHNTARFPRLVVEVLADVPRDVGLNPDRMTAPERALAVFDAFDPLLHRVDGGGFWWGGEPGEGVRVVSSKRLTEPDLMEIPDGDGMVRLTAQYAVTLG